MRERLARGAYSALLRVLTPLYLMRLWWRGAKEPGYRLAWAERLGGGAPSAPGALWLHAVSLGETKAAAALVDALRRECPELRLLLTHGTATGREAGRALLREGDTQVWLPYDTPGATRRFMRRHRPAVGVLMETEIWPNLLHAAQRSSVPMVVANARLSERSARKGRRFSALLRPAGRSLASALAQTPEDAARLQDAGVPHTPVVGNLKYDLQPDPAAAAMGQRWRAQLHRPVLAMTNTRDGEEALLLAAWAQWPVTVSKPLLLIVPRHPQRFDEVATLVQQAGWQLARRSQWGQALPDAAAGAADVWLGDSLGEMAAYYAMADLAVLGGSFAPLGGHNLIESAASGCPIVLGPSTFNFEDAAERALAAGAAWRCDDLPAALALARRLLGEPTRLSEAAAAARSFSASHRGAAQRMARHLAGLWRRETGRAA